MQDLSLAVEMRNQSENEFSCGVLDVSPYRRAWEQTRSLRSIVELGPAGNFEILHARNFGDFGKICAERPGRIDSHNVAYTRRRSRWIERGADLIRYDEQIAIRLESGGHRPFDLIGISDVDIFVHNNHEFRPDPFDRQSGQHYITRLSRVCRTDRNRDMKTDAPLRHADIANRGTD